MCDRLLEGMAGRVDDDVAVLAVRLDPAQQPLEGLPGLTRTGSVTDGG